MEPIIQKLDVLGSIGNMAATMLRAQAHLRRGEVAQARLLLEKAVAAEPPAPRAAPSCSAGSCWSRAPTRRRPKEPCARARARPRSRIGRDSNSLPF